MSTNQALLLGHNMEHALDRLPRDWAEDGVPTSSAVRGYQLGPSPEGRLACLGVEEHQLLCPTCAVPDLRRKALSRAIWQGSRPLAGFCRCVSGTRQLTLMPNASQLV